MSAKGNNFDFQTTNMKPALTFFYFTAALILILSTGNTAVAQQYKLRQTTSMMGMKSESTIYVKGMRKRTEGGGYAGISNNIVTIEQCDLQRTIKLNDKKKFYFIVPFSKEADEVIDEDVKPAVKSKPVTPPPTQANNKKGGVITMDSKFDVKVADHKIKVPALYSEKIAENVQVTFHTEMIVFKK